MDLDHLKRLTEERRIKHPDTDSLVYFDRSDNQFKSSNISIPFENGTLFINSQTKLQREINFQPSEQSNTVNEHRSPIEKLLFSLKSELNDDKRSKASIEALSQFTQNITDGFAISVGGGPKINHQHLLNVNISPFENVDIVADAYQLPFSNESVDKIFCEAVLEHLEFPDRAISEFYRVLKKGGEVYCITPFIQPYHAHPDHFQGFTLNGHNRLFLRRKFKNISSGPCVGPINAVLDGAKALIHSGISSKRIAKSLIRFLTLVAYPLKRLDERIVNSQSTSSKLFNSSHFFYGLKPF